MLRKNYYVQKRGYIIYKGVPRFFFCPRVHFTPIVRHDLAVAFSLPRLELMFSSNISSTTIITRQRKLVTSHCAKKLPIMRCIQVPRPRDTSSLCLQLFYCIINQGWERPRKATSFRIDWKMLRNSVDASSS